MRFALLPLLLLLTLPTLSGQAAEKKISSAEILWLMVARELCPEVVDPEVVEVAVQAMDDATPTDMRGFLVYQQQMLVDRAATEGHGAAERMCAAARVIVGRHGSFAR